MYSLTCTPRDVSASLSSLRKEGVLPAVVYGPKQEAASIAISLKDFQKVFREAGESSIIELSGASAAPLQVLVHDLDLDPVTSIPRHADFYAIEKGAKVEVAVPLVFVGESPAVKGGANLVKVLHELEIEAEAAALPHEINIDISVLAAVGDQIHAKDIVLPAGVTLVTGAEEVIVLAQEVEEEVVEAAPAADLSAIEVEKKGKEEEAAPEAAA